MKLFSVRPVIHYKKFPPLFFLSLGAIAALMVCVYVLKAREAQKTQSLLESYAKALSEMSAANLSEAAMSDDLVSMHAILQALAEKERVVFSAVHNLENKRLVQIGDPSFDMGALTYDAQIPLHDSLFGRVTVGVDTTFPGDDALNYLVWAIGVLLLIALSLALYESFGSAWYWVSLPNSDADKDGRNLKVSDEDVGLNDPSQNIENTKETDVNESESSVRNSEALDEPLDALGAAAEEDSDLILVVSTVSELKKQLNGDRFDQLLQSLEHRISEVLALYGGSLLNKVSEQGYFCVRFTGSSDGLAPFHAACAAHLIQELCRLDKFKLRVQAHICRAYEDIKIPLKAEGILFHAFGGSNELAARLELKQEEGGVWHAKRFKQPFAQLLDDQCASLSGAELNE